MANITLTDLGEARAARTSMLAFIAATKPVTKAPNGEFATEARATAHVWGRQYARNHGAGHLDNAISHLARGTAGSWTDETLALLRADRAAIGDGIAPKLVGDVRAHVADAAASLDGRIQQVRPGVGRLALIGAAIGAATLVTVLALRDH